MLALCRTYRQITILYTFKKIVIPIRVNSSVIIATLAIKHKYRLLLFCRPIPPSSHKRPLYVWPFQVSTWRSAGLPATSVYAEPGGTGRDLLSLKTSDIYVACW